MRIAGKPPFPPRVHSFLLASSSSASLRCRGMHLSSLAGFRWWDPSPRKWHGVKSAVCGWCTPAAIADFFI